MIGGFNPSEKYQSVGILVGWDDYSQHMEQSTNVPDHQPDIYICIYIYIVSVYFSPNSYSMHVTQQIDKSLGTHPEIPGPIGPSGQSLPQNYHVVTPIIRLSNSHWGLPFGVYPKHIIIIIITTKFQIQITKLAFKNFKQLGLAADPRISHKQTRP